MKVWINRRRAHGFLGGQSFGDDPAPTISGDYFCVNGGKIVSETFDHYPGHQFGAGWGWLPKKGRSYKVQPPFLLTDQSDLRCVYDGLIAFEINPDQDARNEWPKMQVCDYLVRGCGWFGVVQFRLRGFFRKKAHWALVAFATDEVVVAPGPIRMKDGIAILGQIQKLSAQPVV